MSMYQPPLHPDFPHGIPPKPKTKGAKTPAQMVAANGPGPERYGPSPTATAVKVKQSTRSVTLPVPGGGLLVTAALSPHAGSGAKVGGKAGKGQKGLPK